MEDCCNVLVRALRRNRPNGRYTYKEIYYEEWAHGIMEAEKFHDLLSASWTPRGAHGGIPSLA